MNNIHLIKTEEDYDKIMSRILKIAKTNPKPNSPEYEKLMILSLLIEEYDKTHYPEPISDPIESIKFRMEQQGLRPVNMKEYFGSTNRYYDIMNKKRKLSITMIKKLHDKLGIPYESLIA